MTTLSEPLAQQMQRLIDKEAIRDAVHRYCRGIDRLDMEAIRLSYHPDAFDDHGGYKGGVDGLLEWIARRHPLVEQSLHLVGNITIDFLADDVAVAESYEIVRQRYPAEAQETIRAWVGDAEVGPDERLSVSMYARMIDRFEKRDGAWRIARRTVVVEDVETRLAPARKGPPVSAEPVRGPGDPVYVMLRG